MGPIQTVAAANAAGFPAFRPACLTASTGDARIRKGHKQRHEGVQAGLLSVGSRGGEGEGQGGRTFGKQYRSGGSCCLRLERGRASSWPLFIGSAARSVEAASDPKHVLRRGTAGKSWRARGSSETARESRRGRGPRGAAGASWRGRESEFVGGSPGAPSDEVRSHACQRCCTHRGPIPNTFQQPDTTGES